MRLNNGTYIYSQYVRKTVVATMQRNLNSSNKQVLPGGRKYTQVKSAEGNTLLTVIASQQDFRHIHLMS